MHATQPLPPCSTLPLLAPTLLDPSCPVPAEVIRTPPGLPQMAEWRWSVYRNNVQHSLATALADTFEVVQQLVGPEFFRTAALHFLRVQPPRSPLLRRYGRGFPAFLRRYQPARTLPYLADVARLEWLRLQVLHAPDPPPGRLAATRAQWAARLADPALLMSTRVRFREHLGLIQSPHPVVSIWAAHQGTVRFEDIDPQRAESAVLLREGDTVTVRPLETGQAAFLRALRRRQTLDEALQAAAVDHLSNNLAGNRENAPPAAPAPPAPPPPAPRAADPIATLALLLHHDALRPTTRDPLP